MEGGRISAVVWRDDLDALQFDLDDETGAARQCLVHRLAFRSLLSEPATPNSCLAYFHGNRGAFEAAARAKVERDALPDGARFHLTSRDIAQALRDRRCPE